MQMHRSDFPALCKAAGIVRLHGHRGQRGLMPENTLPGFAAAFAAGVQIVELDVLVTHDNVPVVTHDPLLAASRTRDASGHWLEKDGPPIISLSYDQLAAYNVGSRAEQTPDSWPEQARLDSAAIPKLADICALANHPGHQHCWLNIEIKSSPLASHLTPPPEHMARLVIAEILAAGLAGRTLLQSFDWRVLAAAESIAPQIPRSCLSYYPEAGAADEMTIYPGSPWMAGMKLDRVTLDRVTLAGTNRKNAASEAISNSMPRLVRQAGAVHWAPFYQDITARHVAEAQKAGLIVSVWTVNAAEDIVRMIEFGVDGIITDYPGRVQQLLTRRGMSWTD